ncbi:MAG: hypothetical protein US60_C0043G0009 [Microgenomates group bacterium GW2011_GWC1_37_8]|uniref:Uncharacterized protein n=1 Tax=Candidatus Woesebacteria bacterium GW2011_GWB1_38_8 TaxID=1618570 RepID=A0A0G0KZ72_9BACT|nr:MAG: hypothetical protein US60_C0043G0009 [Microgenomates group bacterium GW2011_GWC1_37_8]KKQ84983.1 MAG: hypothetical protein UT08_C0011G0001 [Candidatus Woesebacteria bacterium GW2011_GWB1_38_8]
MEIRAHPVVRIENKILSSIRGENILKLIRRYRVNTFIDSNPREKIPSFQDLLNYISFGVYKLPGKPWELKYTYKDIRGTTKILLHNEYNPGRPTLIFHHGLGILNQIQLKVFTNDILIKKFNIFSIKAANHASQKEIRSKCLNSFMNLALTITASVLAMDEIINFNKNNSNKKTIVVGVSLGGIVASLHYFYFNSADLYFPIIAYPNLGEIILNINLKDLVANYKIFTKNKSLKKSFTIPESLKNKPKSKIFPIIAEHDEIMEFNKAKRFWNDYNLTVYETGHYSIFIKIKEIRKLIVDKTFN